jgi:chitin disaccharide deacetylase
MIRLIINADDLGASDRINEAIFANMAGGCITSATLMATGPALESALSSLKSFPNCSFGAHLDLTGFPSLTNCPVLDSLRDIASFSPAQLRKVHITGAMKNAAFKEWREQITRLVNAGVTVSHIDSHHHIHTIPGFFGVLRDLLKETGIRRVRISQNLFIQKKSVLKLANKWIWNKAISMLGHGVTTAGFADFDTFAQRVCTQVLSYKTFEAMVHPGTPDFDLETERLVGDWKSKSINPIRLISYNDISGT